MNIAVKKLNGLSVLQISFLRSLLSLFICLPLLFRLGISPWGTNRLGLLSRGFFGTLGLVCYFYSIKHLPLATAVTVQNLSPIFTTVFAIFILKEALSLSRASLFIIAFLGVALIKGFDPRFEMAELYVALGGALFAGIAYNFVRLLRTTESSLVIIFYFALVCCVVLFIPAFVDWHPIKRADWIWILCLGLCTQIAQWFMTKSFAMGKAAEVSIVKYSGVLMALFFGWLLFDEGFHFWAIVGMILVVLALIASLSIKGGNN